MALSAYINSLLPREDLARALHVDDSDRTILLERTDDIVASAVGALILERLAAHEGSRIPLPVVRELRKRLIAGFKPQDIMKLEVEAYNALAWLVSLGDLHPEHEPPPPPTGPDEAVPYDPGTPTLDLLRRAIEEKFDVKMTYYTQSRGQLNSRRVSPSHVEAETYLHAYCHARREERVFRISRIGEIHPIDGHPVRTGEYPAVASDSEEKPDQGELDLT